MGAKTFQAYFIAEPLFQLASSVTNNTKKVLTRAEDLRDDLLGAQPHHHTSLQAGFPN
jgi:hypothetical protein